MGGVKGITNKSGSVLNSFVASLLPFPSSRHDRHLRVYALCTKQEKRRRRRIISIACLYGCGAYEPNVKDGPNPATRPNIANVAEFGSVVSNPPNCFFCTFHLVSILADGSCEPYLNDAIFQLSEFLPLL